MKPNISLANHYSHSGHRGHSQVGLKLIFQPARVLVHLTASPMSQLEPNKTRPLFTHLHHRTLTRQQALPGTQVSNVFLAASIATHRLKILLLNI